MFKVARQSRTAQRGSRTASDSRVKALHSSEAGVGFVESDSRVKALHSSEAGVGFMRIMLILC